MANSGLTQRQTQPNNAYHCKECSMYFDSMKSLDVHLHYHKENLLSKWATQASFAAEEANNNGGHKNSNSKHAAKNGDYKATIAAPADSSDAMMKKARNPPPVYAPQFNNAPYQEQQRFSPAANGHQQMFNYQNGLPNPNPTNFQPFQPNYMMRPAENNQNSFYDGNILPQNYPTSYGNSPSPSPSSTGPPPNFRYHPYQQPGGGYTTAERAVSSSSYAPRPSSPQQCEKCGAICDTSAALSEHLTTMHPPTPVAQHYPQPTNNGFHSQVKVESYEFSSEAEVKQEEEPQAEILDLDSHKVHVYQPPEEEEPRGPNPHSVSAMLWGSNHSPPEEKMYPQQQQHMVQRNPTPDFVTSSLTSPQSYQQPRYHPVPEQPQQPITSSQVPNVAPSLPTQPNSPQLPPAPTGKGNASWKSNEARRPKTYNCSACNKWFTSSGHLKRHYNTTLHKNAVKQSGAPDPATLPINSHHHPNRDPNYVPRGRRDEADSVVSPVSSLGNEDSSRSDEYGPMAMNGMMNGGSQMIASPPNRLAGPPEYEQHPSGGLHSMTYMDTGHRMMMPTRPSPSPPRHDMMPDMMAHRPRHSPPPLMMQQHSSPPHLVHHPQPQPHPVALLTSAQMEQQMMQNYPNALPPHVITSQMPTTAMHTTSTSQITSTGNPEGGHMMSLGEEYQPMQHYFGNVQGGMFHHLMPAQTLPSFSQLNHSPYSGQSLTVLPGFNGMTPSYLVPTDNVGGLNHNHQQHLLMESYQNNVFVDEVTSLNDRFNNSDSNTSLGENVLSPIGTPDCPTSTKSDFDPTEVKEEILDIKSEDNLLVSSTQEINIYSSKSISNGTLHKCIDCDKVFNKACYLTQHNKSFHSGLKPFKCHRCGKRFPAEYLYEEHITKHAGDKPYKCEICPKQFNHKTDLRRHMCLHTGEKPYACEVCGKGFIRKDHMLKHCITHRRKLAAASPVQQHITAQ